MDEQSGESEEEVVMGEGIENVMKGHQMFGWQTIWAADPNPNLDP